jgi:hypothetical protein
MYIVYSLIQVRRVINFYTIYRQAPYVQHAQICAGP